MVQNVTTGCTAQFISLRLRIRLNKKEVPCTAPEPFFLWDGSFLSASRSFPDEMEEPMAREHRGRAVVMQRPSRCWHLEWERWHWAPQRRAPTTDDGRMPPMMMRRRQPDEASAATSGANGLQERPSPSIGRGRNSIPSGEILRSCRDPWRISSR